MKKSYILGGLTLILVSVVGTYLTTTYDEIERMDRYNIQKGRGIITKYLTKEEILQKEDWCKKWKIPYKKEDINDDGYPDISYYEKGKLIRYISAKE